MVSCYVILIVTVVSSTIAGTSQDAKLYLAEKPGYVRVCEQQATLTNAPGLEMVLLMPFSSCHDPAAFGPKVISVQRKGVAFLYDSSSLAGISEDVLGVKILSLWQYESVLEGKDGF